MRSRNSSLNTTHYMPPPSFAPLRTYMQAASAGHVQAQYNVAMMHLAGKGTQRSCKPALNNLKALVEKGPQAAVMQAAHEAFFRGHHNQVCVCGWDSFAAA